MAKKSKLQLSEELVIEKFGQPKEIKNGEWIYPCPCCLDEGGDSDHDHLKINIAKGFITCFANPEHSKELVKQYFENFESEPKVSTGDLEVSHEKVHLMHNELKNNKDAMELLYSKGYNEQTINKMQIGLYCGDWFVLPMITLDNQLVGYEFRHSNNFKFSHKSKGYADDERKTLCLINDSGKQENLLVMAGFKDGHVMWRYLQESGNLLDYTVVTASNGEANTLRALNANSGFVKKFKKIIICLDKDKTGKASTRKIALELGLPVHELKLPFLKNEEDKKFKDFTDWYNLAKEIDYNASILPEKVKLIPESRINKCISNEDTLNKAKLVDISKLSGVQAGIYPTKYGYYEVYYKGQDNEKAYLIRKTNFTFHITREVISNNNKFDFEKAHKLELHTSINGIKTKSVIFSPDDLTKPEKISEILKTNGIHFSCLSANELKSVLETEYRDCNRILHIFENPGTAKVGDNEYWLYKNACVITTTGEIVLAQKDSLMRQGVIKLDNDCEMALEPTKGMHAPVLPDEIKLESMLKKYKYLEETANLYKSMHEKSPDSINILTSALIRNTLESYNGSIEPFMLLGNIIMSPAIDTVYEEITGYPVSYAYGEARSGKSNILTLGAKIYGYKSNYLSGGNDTSNNLMHNMEYYSKTPILFSEIEANIRKRFSENVKALYDRIPRKLMKAYGENQNIKAINGTIHFATNDMIPKNEQTMSRLIFTEFKQNNFDYTKAIPFNSVRDDLIGLILPQMLPFLNHKKYIETLLRKNILEIKLLKAESKLQIDDRSANNIAVAKTGIDLLFIVAGIDLTNANNEIKQMLANYKAYLAQYAGLVETKDHFVTFMEILTELFKQDRPASGKDYKLYNGGLAIYLKPIMPAFREILKRTSEPNTYIPTETEIKHAAEKHGCETNYNVDFSGKTRRALVIPKDVEGVDYIISIIGTTPEEQQKCAGKVI